MSKIKFLIGLCILAIAEIANAQQQVSKEEAENAVINTLYNKESILRRSANTDIDTVHSLFNSRSNILTFINKERRKIQ
jgi:sensor domain CHASE-containing protein